MAIRIILLGKLADFVSDAEISVEADGGLDWDGLLAHLDNIGPVELRDMVAGEQVSIAINGVLLKDKQLLMANSGDEIALLPPVSGG